MIEDVQLAVGGVKPVAGGGTRRVSTASRFRDVFRASWSFRIGTVIMVVALLLAAVGPYLARYPLDAATSATFQAPSLKHWFGTDANGFDVFSRVIAAPRIDVTAALAATVISFVLGASIGLMTSYFPGRAGEWTMRAVDTLQSFPLYLLAMVTVVMTGRSAVSMVLVIGVATAPIFVRLTRAEVLSVRTRLFVEAARAAGEREVWIALREVLPNSLSPALAQAPITMGTAILTIAGLSFLGAGFQPPTAEWGSMITSGASNIILGIWWTSVFPGIAISVTVFGSAAMGEGLREVYLRTT